MQVKNDLCGHLCNAVHFQVSVVLCSFVRSCYLLTCTFLMLLFYVFFHHSKQLLQNDLEVTKVDLDEVLPAATIMVVSVTASTTQG